MICTYLFGGLDSILIVLLVTMLIDYLTGICKAIYLKKLNSSIGLKGIIKKFGYLLIVILAALADKVLNNGTLAIRTIVIYFFIANESLSILENWALMGLPLPKKLYEVFEKLKDSDKESKS